MKYIILLLLLIGCGPKILKYKKGDCIRTNLDPFYEKVCTNGIFQIDRKWIGDKYDYIVTSYYLDVRNGCPAQFTLDEKEVIEQVTCPEDF